MTAPAEPIALPRRVQWSRRLEVGVPEIDAQHQELYRRSDRLLRAVAERRGSGEVRSLVQYLAKYIGEHFAAEQQMMELSGYSGLGDHMAEHHWFEDEYRKLVDQLDHDGVTVEVVRGLVALLGDWLDHHLEVTDSAFGRHLAQVRGHRAKGASA